MARPRGRAPWAPAALRGGDAMRHVMITGLALALPAALSPEVVGARVAAGAEVGAAKGGGTGLGVGWLRKCARADKSGSCGAGAPWFWNPGHVP